MLLNFENETFSLTDKTQLKNSDENIAYSGIYDFSYKGRIRIFDKDNNEVGYVQFKILSVIDQIGFFDKNNKQIAYIKLTKDINDIVIQDDNWHFVGDIYNKNFTVVDKDNHEIMAVNNNTMNIKDDSNALKCVMCMFVISNPKELEK